MSWTDVFPVLTDDQIFRYQQHATDDEREVLKDWTGVSRTVNPQLGKHVVATSLFWKNSRMAEGELPPITREIMKDAGKLGLVSRFAPWEHYVQPLLAGARLLREARPDVVFRVYLAADLEFLIGDLVDAGCEVKLMHGSSIRHNPGAMWRFLALEEEGRWVTVTDSDRAHEVLHDVERTERIMKAGLGLWRVPYIFDSVRNANDPGYYRPITASQFGAAGGQPVELLMNAFLWHTMRGTMPNECTLGAGQRGKKAFPIFGTDWPTYGFDEWFLLAAMYPRLAFEGVLTFFPLKERAINHWFALDVEYVTWANQKSEVLYFGKSDLLTKKKKPKALRVPKSAILDRMLAASLTRQRETAARTLPRSQERLTLVVARYKEDVRWLLKVPDDVTIVLYNKGPEIDDVLVVERVDHLLVLPNRGRESDTYLYHVQNFEHGPPDEWTVFCQGEPFPHSPGFLRLLEQRNLWQDVQPLTNAYMQDGISPPGILRRLEKAEWLAGIPVRTDLLSAHTLRMTSWYDPSGGGFIESYCNHYGVPPGWSVTGHFLEACGLDKLAEEAWRATLVRGVYAAIFGVRNERLQLLPQKCLRRMRKLACEHHSVGYVFERLWLHLFGLPFIGFEASAEIAEPAKPHLVSQP